MSDLEKWAWWTFGVVFATVAAYVAFITFVGHGPATASVFALLGLTALPATSRRWLRGRHYDEREREISRKAVRAGFSAFWLAFIGFILLTGFTKGWETTLAVPVWILAEALWWAAVLILGVQALAKIVLFRGWYHA